MDRPLVTIILPTYNAAADVDRAVHSALGQSWRELEVIVVDDASSDGTVAVVEAWCRRDPRVRLIRQGVNGGPARARNAALAAGSDTWIALLDADDAFAPERLERLLEAAARTGADLVADNLRLLDGITGRALGSAWPPAEGAEPRVLCAAEFVRRNLFGQPGFALGYLKPVMRRALLDRHGIRYRDDVRIGEDYHLYLDCLLAGARFVLVPEAMYDYQLSPNSISRRLPEADIARLAELNRRLIADAGAAGDVLAALCERQDTIERMLGHTRFVNLLKDRAWLQAARLLLAHPAVLPLVARYGRESVLKRLGRLGFHGVRA